MPAAARPATDYVNKGNFNPPSTVITTFEGSAGKRTIKHGDADTLKFKFQNRRSPLPWSPAT